MSRYYNKRNINKLIKHHGAHVSRVISMEELSELSVEISKCVRGKKREDKLVEEIADVYIILNMIRTIEGVSAGQVSTAIDEKMKRNLDRIKG